MISRPQVPYLPRLRRLREEAVLSQEQLAKVSGVSKPTIVRIELGRSVARVSTIRKLAIALGVQPRELMGPE